MFDDVRAVGSGNPTRSASWVCLRSHRVTRVPTTSVLVRRKSPLYPRTPHLHPMRDTGRRSGNLGPSCVALRLTRW